MKPAGIAVLVLAGALAIAGYLRWQERPRFAYIAHPLSDADYSALAARPGWHAQRLIVAAGVELRGLRREPLRPGGPWILFFGGNSQRLLNESQQMLEALCVPRGWGGIVWAYRGYDSSGGGPDPAALTQDGYAAYLNLLSTQKIPPSAVHLVGFSLGTSIAAAVAARAHEAPPASLTLLAPMTVLYMGERAQLRLHRYETMKWLDRIASPTLVVHGTRDATLNVENGRSVAESLGSRAQLLELPELGHKDIMESGAVQDAVRSFIGQHLATRDGS